MALANVPSSLKADLVRQVEGILHEGERILWCQQPDAMNLISRNWTVWALVSVIALLPTLLTFHSQAPQYAQVAVKTILGFILLVFAGLAQTWAYIKARETIYVLTNRRAIIIEPNRQRDYKVLGRLEIVKCTDELSDIIFAHEETCNGLETNSRGPQLPVGFMAIKHADLVEQHLKSIFTVLIVRHDPPRIGDTAQLG